MSTAQITVVETGTPTRSKGRGWARIEGIEGSFATPKGQGRHVTVAADREEIVVEKLRTVSRIVVTGDRADTVVASLGSPQSYDVTVRGARRAG